MSSLFAFPGTIAGRRAIAHGGLGGLVQIDPDSPDGSVSSSTWRIPWIKPKGKSSPVDDRGRYSSKEFVAVLPTEFSPSSYYGPGSRGPSFDILPDIAVKEHMAESNRLLLSPLNRSAIHCFHHSLPATPKTPHVNLPPSPIELPGSLLLASQGFPQQDPPITPPRQIIERRKTDESWNSSFLPDLTSSASSDPDESKMVKPFGSPKRKAPRQSKGAGSSGSSDPSDIRNNASKPFQCMTVDELLERLPSLKLEVIQGVWMQALRQEYTRLKILLEDAGKISLDTHYELKNFGEDLQSIAGDARKISITYERAVKSAESLLERDAEGNSGKVERLQRDLCAANTAIEKLRNSEYLKDRTNLQLRESIDLIVTSFTSFMRKNEKVFDEKDPEYQPLLHILDDYRYSARDAGSSVSQYIRVLETTYLKDVSELQESKTTNIKYRELAMEQNNIIRTQSLKLDDQVESLQKAFVTIRTRDQEIKLLRQEIHKHEDIIKDYENGLSGAQATKDEYDSLVKAHEDLQWTLNSVKNAHEKELEHRDLEIANLRAKLGNTTQELAVRKADVKNVITHTQALLSPHNDSDMQLNLASQVTRGLLKIAAKDKSKKQRSSNLPHSLSTTSLPLFPPKVSNSGQPGGSSDYDWRSNVASSMYPPLPPPPRRMEPRNAKADMGNFTNWGCGMVSGLAEGDYLTVPSRKRNASESPTPDPEPFPDLVPRPRSDSLGALSLYNLSWPKSPISEAGSASSKQRLQLVDQPLKSPLNMHKELPPEPCRLSRLGDHRDSFTNDTFDKSIFYNPPLPSSPASPTVPRHIVMQLKQTGPGHLNSLVTSNGKNNPQLKAHKRVLSNIAEGSIEGSSPESDRSSAGHADPGNHNWRMNDNDHENEGGYADIKNDGSSDNSLSSSHRAALRSGLDVLSAMERESASEEESEEKGETTTTQQEESEQRRKSGFDTPFTNGARSLVFQRVSPKLVKYDEGKNDVSNYVTVRKDRCRASRPPQPRFSDADPLTLQATSLMCSTPVEMTKTVGISASDNNTSTEQQRQDIPGGSGRRSSVDARKSLPPVQAVAEAYPAWNAAVYSRK